jgi:hypothetical protein
LESTCEAKVSDFDERALEKEVGWFDVSMHDVAGVEYLEGSDDLRPIGESR